MSNVMELSLRGASNLEKLMRAVLLDSENKVPADRLRIVGAIAEGAVMESGSNANGYWVRLADGTQVCTGSVSISLTASESYKYEAVTYPAAFVSPPIAISGTYVGAANGTVSDAGTPQPTYCTICISPARGFTYGSDVTGAYRYISIGRWKA